MNKSSIRMLLIFIVIQIILVTSININLKDYGGKGDNFTDNTNAFKHAIAAIKSSTKHGMDATLYVGPGIFATFPFNLTSNMVLFLKENTTIVSRGCEKELIENATCEMWPQLPPLKNYGLDADIGAYTRYQSFIHVTKFVNVSIVGSGETSIIDGSGPLWWKPHVRSHLTVGRPHLIEALDGNNFVIRDVLLKDSAFWTLHPTYVTSVLIERIKVLSPLIGAPNTDGIDPDACTDVIIRDSTISTNDDCIAIKAGLECFGKVYGPTKNVIIQNVSCVNAIVIGSEMSGGVKNISIENSTGRLYYKTGKKRGGYVTDVVAKNIVIPSNYKIIPPSKYGIRINTNYDEKPSLCGNSWNPQPSIIERLSFVNITGEENILISNWSIDIDGTLSSIIDLDLKNIKLPIAESGIGFSCETSLQTKIEGKVKNVNPAPISCSELHNQN
eukprot:g1910.t1